MAMQHTKNLRPFAILKQCKKQAKSNIQADETRKKMKNFIDGKVEQHNININNTYYSSFFH